MSADRLASVDLAFDFCSDVGRKREVNEDSALIDPPVFLVADGMGGYDAGDQASAAVVASFRDVLGAGRRADLGGVGAALAEAERRVGEVSRGTAAGAGSTLTGAVLIDHGGEPHWLIVNVGDSRVYRLYGVEFEQLTVDHSLVQELIDAGQLAPDDRRDFVRRNAITRAIGAFDARADSWLMPVTTGERLLMCSDGLHGELSDEEIREILTVGGRPAATAATLVAAANRAGGRDNITALVVDVRGGGAAQRDGVVTASGVLGLGTADDDEDTVPL